MSDTPDLGPADEAETAEPAPPADEAEAETAEPVPPADEAETETAEPVPPADEAETAEPAPPAPQRSPESPSRLLEPSPVPRVSAARPSQLPKAPATLAIDVGGTGLKASVLDSEGKLLADRVRVATTYPCSPSDLVEELRILIAPLPSFERVSVGFPGVVRSGRVLTAPHFVTKSGPGSLVVKKLLRAWTGFDLAGALEGALGSPVRVANDADLQGLDVVRGDGLEFVVTFGTGVGTAMFSDGRLAPHLELAHHPFRKDETYNEQLGDAARQRVGLKRWRRRVHAAISNFESLVNYDHLYIGGGNSRHLVGHVESDVTIVDNVAGILGGIKLWADEPG